MAHTSPVIVAEGKVCLIAFVACFAAGCAWHLDQSFATDGVLTMTETSGEAWTILLQPDRKIVIAGDKFLARFKPNGQPDENFHEDDIHNKGWVETSVSGDPRKGGVGLDIDSAGKLIVVGFRKADAGDQDFVVERYTKEGHKEPSEFITDTLNNRGHDGAANLVIQSDGRIVVVGNAVPKDFFDFVVVRLENQTLQSDHSFNGGKPVVMDIGHDDFPTAVVLGVADGKILVAGTASGDTPAGGKTYQIAVARFANDGKPDVTLKPAGFLLPGIFLRDQRAFQQILAVCPDGGIVVTGADQLSPTNSQVLKRFKANGEPDARFGENGIKEVSKEDQFKIRGITLQGRKVLVYGISKGGGFELRRYSSDTGKRDIFFGNNGRIVTTMGGSSEPLAAAATSDEIVITGVRQIAGQPASTVILRYVSSR